MAGSHRQGGLSQFSLCIEGTTGLDFEVSIAIQFAFASGRKKAEGCRVSSRGFSLLESGDSVLPDACEK